MTRPDGNLSGATAANFTTTNTYDDDGELRDGHGQPHRRLDHRAGDPVRLRRRRQPHLDQRPARQDHHLQPTTPTTSRPWSPTPIASDAHLLRRRRQRRPRPCRRSGVAANSLTAGVLPDAATRPTTATGSRPTPPPTPTTPSATRPRSRPRPLRALRATRRPRTPTTPPGAHERHRPADQHHRRRAEPGHRATPTTPPASSLTKTAGYGTAARSTTSYCYDPDGDKTAIGRPGREHAPRVAACSTTSPYQTSSAYQTGYSYDSLGELVSKTPPATTCASASPTTSYTYDPAGNQLTSRGPERRHDHQHLHAAQPARDASATPGSSAPLGQLQLRRQRQPHLDDRRHRHLELQLRPLRRAHPLRERRRQDRLLHLRRRRQHHRRSPTRSAPVPPGHRPTPSPTATTTPTSSPRSPTSTATRSRSATPPTGCRTRSRSARPATRSPRPTTRRTRRRRSRSRTDSDHAARASPTATTPPARSAPKPTPRPARLASRLHLRRPEPRHRR